MSHLKSCSKYRKKKVIQIQRTIIGLVCKPCYWISRRITDWKITRQTLFVVFSVTTNTPRVMGHAFRKVEYFSVRLDADGWVVDAGARLWRYTNATVKTEENGWSDFKSRPRNIKKRINRSETRLKTCVDDAEPNVHGTSGLDTFRATDELKVLPR